MFNRLAFRALVSAGVLAVCVHDIGAREPYRSAADRPVDILHIRLDLDVCLIEQSISGTAIIDFRPNRRLAGFALDAIGHEVSSVRRLNAQGQTAGTVRFTNTGKQLLLRFDDSLNRGERLKVEVAYRVREPKSGLHFFRPTTAEPKTPWMVWSQGEPIANRYWFPCFDHPNERQSTEIIARVERGFSVLSNGTLIEQREIENGRRVQFHWKQTKPHVSYLVTLVAGKFAIVRDQWRGRPVTYYVTPERKADARRTFGRTTEMLDFFSKRFGIEYPWAKYAQVVVEQFTSGGMENTSATTLYSGVMHDERAMLDSTPDRLIAHELGHQWWGDLVTCRDWAHLWLNEGFATYCEVLWYEHKLGIDERDYLLYQKSRSARSGKALERPIVDRRYSSPGTMFDNRAYPKGGWVLHMLRSRLGDDDFFRGLKRFGTVFAYRTAETTDLRKTFERLYGVSLERFFHDWTEKKGHPKLTVKSTWQPDSRQLRIEVRQTQSGDPFRFPLKIELAEAGPENSPSVTIAPTIDGREQTYFIPVRSRPTMVRVDAELTLLAEITEEKPRDWWVRQLSEGASVAERIRAVEHFAVRGGKAELELLASRLKSDPFYGVRVEAAAALAKSVKPASRAALIAGLAADHPKVRRACAAALAKHKADPVVERALMEKHKRGDQSYFVEAAVLQSLASVQAKPNVNLLHAALQKDSHRDVIRSAALTGLGRSQSEQAVRTLMAWTKRGHSRRCRSAAMAALASSIGRHQLSPQLMRHAVDALAAHLRDPGPRVRRFAVTALGGISSLPPDKRQMIADLAESDPNGRVRVVSREALRRLESKRLPAGEIKQLRGELDKLRQRYEELQERLKRVEPK